MVLIPSIMPDMNSFMVIILLGRYMARATSSPAKVPRVSPATGFWPMASAKLTPWKKPPTYAMPRMAVIIRVTMGSTRSSTVPLGSMAPARVPEASGGYWGDSSAFFMGPKSKLVALRKNTIAMVSRA